MTDKLADRRCVPCEGGVTPYTEAEARAALAALDPAWRLDAAARLGRRPGT